MKYLVVLFLFLSSVLICFSQNYDDIYYSPKKNTKTKSQNEKISEGKLIKIDFIYKNAQIDWKLSEKDYIKKIKTEKNNKIQGSGESWEAEWFKNRKEILEPLFIKSLDKNIQSKITLIDSIADFLIEINVANITIGYNYGFAKQFSELDIDVKFIDKNGDTLAEMSNYSAPSTKTEVRGGLIIGGFSELTRLEICYKNAAKDLSKYINNGYLRPRDYLY